MLPSRSLGPLFALALAGTVAIACGTSDGDSEFDENAQNGGDAGNGGSTGDNTGFGGGNGDGTGNGTGTGGNNGPACAAQSAVAERAPAYIYFLFDKSGSMDDGGADKKLFPVEAALTSFLKADSSKGISASLTLFPAQKTGDQANCSSDTYKTPVVSLSPLPEKAQAIIDKLPKTTDLGDTTAGTPTRPAVAGLLPVAVQNTVTNKDGKTVVIMLTDGDPNKCNSNEVSNVETELKKYKDKVPTYVIGIGDVTSLDKIAAAGGTGAALIVSVGDAAKTQRELSEKIEQIRLSALSCDVAIPAPPSGETLDLDKVNVSFTPKGGTKSALGYDPDCKADGWRFDNPTTPTKIALCTCDATKKDPDSKIEVEFGCARRTGGIK